jgi:hypothetical protein
MSRVGHIAHTGEKRGVYRVLVAKPERKRPLRRLGVDVRKVHFTEIGWEGVDWIDLLSLCRPHSDFCAWCLTTVMLYYGC